jgi:phytoene synthase
MRILPKAERTAMFQIYAFCRAVDDIADEEGRDRDARRAALTAWREDLRALYQGRPGGRAQFLAQAVRRFSLKLEDFLAVVDGMQMDVDSTIVAPDRTTLDLYCDRVASAVGRLSVRVFGMEEAVGPPLAHHLGRALQLTNVLRDLDEDAAVGRLYLAEEWLASAGVTSREPKIALEDPAVDAAARLAAAQALLHYGEADRLLAAHPKGRLAAPRLMSAVYAQILRQTLKIGWAAPRRRVRLSRPALAWIVLTRGLLAR